MSLSSNQSLWLLVGVLLASAGCASTAKNPKAWWAGEDVCPEGATLHGSPPPDSVGVTPPTEQTTLLSKWSVQCIKDGAPAEKARVQGTRHGSFERWYGNGQTAVRGHFEDGILQSATVWDLRGRVIQQMDSSGSVQLSWWHEDGVKAVSGRTVGRTPHGVWSEYNEAGVQVASVTYTDGRAGPLEGASKMLLFAAGLDFMEGVSHQGLPVTTSTVPFQLAVAVSVDEEGISVDGVPGPRLVDGRFASADVRGAHVSSLGDILYEKAEGAKTLAAQSSNPDLAFTGHLNILAHASTRMATMMQLVYTSSQAEFSKVHIVGNAGLQWPPRTGLSQLQGAHLLGSVRVRLPEIGPPSASPRVEFVEPEVRLFPDRLELIPAHLRDRSRNAASVPQAEQVPCPTGCFVEGGIDRARLTEVLAGFKRDAPAVPDGWESSTDPRRAIVVRAVGAAPLQAVIHIIDAAREHEGAVLYPDVFFHGVLSE